MIVLRYLWPFVCGVTW